VSVDTRSFRRAPNHPAQSGICASGIL
jgi:hypothetical protein